MLSRSFVSIPEGNVTEYTGKATENGATLAARVLPSRRARARMTLILAVMMLSRVIATPARPGSITPRGRGGNSGSLRTSWPSLHNPGVVELAIPLAPGSPGSVKSTASPSITKDELLLDPLILDILEGLQEAFSPHASFFDRCPLTLISDLFSSSDCSAENLRILRPRLRGSPPLPPTPSVTLSFPSRVSYLASQDAFFRSGGKFG
jgi:hypothetical protein